MIEDSPMPPPRILMQNGKWDKSVPPEVRKQLLARPEPLPGQRFITFSKLSKAEHDKINAARQGFAEARAIDRNDPIHLLDPYGHPLCGFAAPCFITDKPIDATCIQCRGLAGALLKATGDKAAAVWSESALDPTWEAGNTKE